MRRTEGILNNLQAWLAVEAPTVQTSCGWFHEGLENDIVVLVDNGGDDSAEIDRKDVSVQVLSRGEDRDDAEARGREIHALLRGRFCQTTLPAVTVGTDVYPAVTAWRFIARGGLVYTGTDENRLHVWSGNYIVTIGG